MAKKDRVVKNDGSYIFTDFSKGLYLLDTPRGLGEQLGSLALVDGRNVWAEKGALIPQYGYEIRATLPSGTDEHGNKIIPSIMGYTTADLSSDSIAVFANTLTGGVTETSVSYADVLNASHSTFDLSKFTVVGSPTITSDGVTSGFTNYTDFIAAYTINSLPTGLDITMKVRTPSQVLNVSQTVFAVKDDIDTNILFYVTMPSGSNLFACGYRKADGTYNNTFFATATDTEYNIIAQKNGGNIKFTINNTVVVDQSDLNTSSNISYICFGSQNGTNTWQGNIDLKECSYSIDGVPTFSGNKTGIDTIKPDDYTVVGTPTISADGVASFGGSNWLLTGSAFDYINKDFDIYFDFETPNALSGSQGLYGYANFDMAILTVDDKFSFIYGGAQLNSGTNVLLPNTKYKAHCYLHGTTIGFTITKPDGTGFSNSNTVTLYTAQCNNFGIGRYGSGGSANIIDLNSFKICVDGDLIYQACLKIPYTLSNTGAKIVDVAYRSRVTDLYTQEGDTQVFDYYILNNTDDTATHIVGSPGGLTGVVYIYSASQGLKRYKTEFNGGFTDPIITRRGKDLLVYDGGILNVFGAYYGNNSITGVQITSTAVPFQDYSSFGIIQVPLDEAQYFWNGKEILIDNNPCTITLVSIGRDDDYAEVRIVPFSGSFDYETTPATVKPYEKTRLVTTLTYVPEDEGIGSTTLVPQMMAVSNNRLFVEHSNGNIYYSSIGFAFTDSNYDIINPFEEAGGAGYFGGFFNDTTKLLSIEDYFNGVLLTKENGFYYLTISVVVDENNNVNNSIQVDKISQAGQRYPSDHVIVRNDVYAYDSNSGSLVKASQANVFGALVAGKTLVTSEFLNVANFNINSGKRFLTYNYESQVLILYYGEDLKRGVVYSIPAEALFPRELDKVMLGYTGFNQGVMGITERGELIQDFKRGMIIPNLSCVAQFEPIGVRDNRMICSTILEVTELNGIDYGVTTQNAGSSYQQIQPSFYRQNSGEALLPFIYSEDDYVADSYQLTSRWAEISSHRTRIYAPMSGRNGVTIQLEFEADKPFCLSMLRLPDFCQGN